MDHGESAGGPFALRWNGWLIFVIAILCICAFIFVQIVLGVFLFFRDHPEIITDLQRYGNISPDLKRQISDPSFTVDFLNAKNLFVLSVLSEATLAIMTFLLARLMLDARKTALGLGQSPRGDQLLIALSAGAGLFLASSLVGAVTTHLFGSHPQPQALALIKHHGALDFVLDFISVAVAAPFAEEIFFRGLVFTALAQRMMPWLAIMLSAAFFGLAHLEKYSFLAIFAIGIGLALLYYRTRNLWLNIIAHATVNTISLVLAYTVPQLVKS
ncbi:MAG: CPBP family intramembrane metalloprotease [Candidatus Eremiobacteraeota bacterium]|nr:CPBP family intramembrane metalloprotease [Candidatus Eremiobacteraeota bacterium]